MNTPDNPFRQRLRRGDRQIGLWLALANAYAAEVVAGAGFDWCAIDAEHAPNTLPTLLATLQALAAYPVQPVIRLPDDNATFIKQVLELGAQNLLVPMVESPQQARALVRATRYPPQGMRGVGAGLARSGRWGRYSDYLVRANDLVCLLVQIESVQAAAQVRDIAAVDGVDGVLFGPADLAASMGLLGQSGDPRVCALIEQSIGEVQHAGKAAGVYVADEALARRYLQAGAGFVAVGSDAGVLRGGAAALAMRFKAGAGDAEIGSPGGGY
jgi:4-hydroxy-2-oxoheptanedioate aldolase